MKSIPPNTAFIIAGFRPVFKIHATGGDARLKHIYARAKAPTAQNSRKKAICPFFWLENRTKEHYL